MKHVTTISMVIFLLSACGNISVNGQQKSSDTSIKTVNAETFKKLIETGEGILLDVRTPEEYESGHIAGAQNINVNDNSFVEKITSLPKDKAIYVYCRSGKRSLKAAGILSENGFKIICNLDNGILGWQSKGFPVTNP